MTKGATTLREFERALKAAGDPTRTRILKLLEGGGLCVCQVQAILALAPSTVSKHLAILKTAGLVEDRRDGKWIEYALIDGGANPHARAVLDMLRGTLDREPVIAADRKRLREVRAVPLERICGLMPAAPEPRAGTRGARGPRAAKSRR